MIPKITLSDHDINVVAACMRVAEDEGCLDLENPKTLALWIAIMDAAIEPSGPPKVSG